MIFPSLAAAIRATSGRRVSIANAKMPGTSFSADPRQCRTGQALRSVPGSTCSVCYSLRLLLTRPGTAQGYAANEAELRRVAALPTMCAERRTWVAAMGDQIKRQTAKTDRYHRWFDGGDLASADVLRLIAQVARKTPDVAHWLPTREAALARGVTLPRNLVLRMSAAMIGAKPRKAWRLTSTVHAKGQTPYGHACPAYEQGGACGDCRACWDPNVRNVSYRAH